MQENILSSVELNDFQYISYYHTYKSIWRKHDATINTNPQEYWADSAMPMINMFQGVTAVS